MCHFTKMKGGARCVVNRATTHPSARDRETRGGYFAGAKCRRARAERPHAPDVLTQIDPAIDPRSNATNAWSCGRRGVLFAVKKAAAVVLPEEGPRSRAAARRRASPRGVLSKASARRAAVSRRRNAVGGGTSGGGRRVGGRSSAVLIRGGRRSGACRYNHRGSGARRRDVPSARTISTR